MIVRIEDDVVAGGDVVMHFAVVTAEVTIARLQFVAAEVEEVQILRVTNAVGGHDGAAIHAKMFWIQASLDKHLRVESEVLVESLEVARAGVVQEVNAVFVQQNQAEIDGLLVRVVDVNGVVFNPE